MYSVGYVSENLAVTGYSDFGAFVQANPNFSLDGWNTDMWEMQGSVPMPKGGTVPDVEAKITIQINHLAERKFDDNDVRRS
ncbi:MAG: hypothetical protein V8T86_16995 [Victivallis sp.]